MRTNRRNLVSAALLFAVSVTLPVAHATVFNLTRFNSPGEWSLGLEPIISFTNGAGLGGQARFNIGATELNNFHVFAGMGFGPRLFRLGTAMTFDFFPDIEGQPGVGLAAQATLQQLPLVWGTEILAIPYIHKTFTTRETEVEPYLAIPVGLALYFDGTYRPVASFVLGGIFKATTQFRFVAELGVGILASETYLSGGVVFTP